MANNIVQHSHDWLQSPHTNLLAWWLPWIAVIAGLFAPTALTVHLVRPRAGTDDIFTHRACDALRERFGISHATLQIEDGDPAHACQLAPANVV
jgi:hypothetical protein